jgi:hypothetical protein
MEKITEEFADKLLKETFIIDDEGNSFTMSGIHIESCIRIDKERTKKEWKKQGYIEQSREQELKEKIEGYEKDLLFDTEIEKTYKEYIKILENKLKDNK